MEKTNTALLENTFIPKEIIPNYIFELSHKYNQSILSIFIYLKQRTNKNNTIYFNYINLLQFLQYDGSITNETKQNDIFLGLITLLLPTHKRNIFGLEINTMNSFKINVFNNILINLLNDIEIVINEEDNRIDINAKTNSIYTIEQLLSCIKDYLFKNEIILYDLTIENQIGYIQIESNIFNYLSWYYIQQNNNLERILKNYMLNDENKLKQLKEQFKISDITTKKINFTILLNIYCFIYKLYILNKNLHKKTYISYSVLANNLHLSNTTVQIYLIILQDIKLIEIEKGSLQKKKITAFKISDKWNNIYQEIEDKNIFKYSIITKSQYKEIFSCYKKKDSNTTQQIKRGRGRPKKNNIL